MTELHYFSRRRWTKLFEEAGWTIAEYGTNGLAYSGFGLLGASMGLPLRSRLSRWAGSSCHVFVLRQTVRAT